MREVMLKVPVRSAPSNLRVALPRKEEEAPKKETNTQTTGEGHAAAA